MKCLRTAAGDVAGNGLVVALEETPTAIRVAVHIVDGNRNSVRPRLVPKHLTNRLIGIEVGPRLEERTDLCRQEIVTLPGLQGFKLLPDLITDRLSRVGRGFVFADDSGTDGPRFFVNVHVKSVESLLRMLHMRRRDQGGFVLNACGDPRDYLKQPPIAVKGIVA